jgi:arylsulfatase A-like enzyme
LKQKTVTIIDRPISRRKILSIAGAGIVSTTLGSQVSGQLKFKNNLQISKKPNLLFIFADQWRAQATGYGGDHNIKTPNLDNMASESLNFTNAVSCCPVCSPFRASLMTGQYPLSHGVFLNDVPLTNKAVSIAQAYNAAGYKTGYIGKWHLNGNGRSKFIPMKKRQGFGFWKAFECTHDYNNSFYYADKNKKRKWDGYDAFAQTKAAQDYIKENSKSGPFALFVSWGPPHDPYDTAPEQYKSAFALADKIVLRPNVPLKFHAKAKHDLAGYYAHIAALDYCLGKLLNTLKKTDIEKNTIVVFTSDHGDMLYSQGHWGKQRPWDESIKIPFLLRYPKVFGITGREIDKPLNSPDIMPTLLSLSGVEIPKTVEGKNYFSECKSNSFSVEEEAALIVFPWPFGHFVRHLGGKEWRGIRTKRYTYVRDLKGPWLLYDNKLDPYQLENLCGKNEYSNLQLKLEGCLMEKLDETNDRFLPGEKYIKKWNYNVDSKWGHPLDENGNPPWYE